MRAIHGYAEGFGKTYAKTAAVGLTTVLLALWCTGCGGGSSPVSSSSSGAGSGGSSGGSSGATLSGSTTVAIQLSSKANDQLVQYTMQIASISLTDQAGKTTTIFNTPTNVDFIPANGNAYPLATVSVPQDVYASASVTIATASFRYTFLDSSGSDHTISQTYTTTPTPVVVVPQPFTISGSAMGLVLSLDVSTSLTIGNYMSPQTSTFSGTPTLDLSVFPLTVAATTPLNGKCIGLPGQITALNMAGSSMTVALAGDGTLGSSGGYSPGASFNVALSSGTQYQGVAAASGLATGDFVNVDLALQPDGSYTATRVEVPDATAADVTSNLVQLSSADYDGFQVMPFQYQGSQLEASGVSDIFGFTYADSTAFQVSARLGSVTGLPFTPVFNGSSLVAGQSTSVGVLSYPTTGSNYPLPTSVTLLPQTIDAVVTGSTTSGSYSVYTVQLAAYDPIAQLNGPPVNPLENQVPNPSVVQVYVGSSTSLLNATQLAVGGTFRFNGLLFDDGGTLRMVADQVNDGVAQ